MKGFRDNFLYIILLLFTLTHCKNPIEEKCNEICRFTTSCILNSQKENALLIDKKVIDKATMQCEGTCTMFQDEFLQCKNEHPNSCEKFYSCLITSGLFN